MSFTTIGTTGWIPVPLENVKITTPTSSATSSSSQEPLNSVFVQFAIHHYSAFNIAALEVTTRMITASGRIFGPPPSGNLNIFFNGQVLACQELA